MGKPLSATNKALLRKSSADAIAVSLSDTRKQMLDGRWLSKSNKYRQRTCARIESDLRDKKVKEGSIKRYIAASALPHCVDGWSFLSRALNAHQNGHPAAALHFGYYAELRAAMSFLATRGVGIFDKRHCIVSKPPKPKAGKPIPPSCLDLNHRGTHVVTWLALEYWANLAKSSEILLTLVRPAGISLRDWLEAYSTPVLEQVGRKWLIDWGLDLRQFAEDRDARNDASYRPGDLSRSWVSDAPTASSFLIEFWSLFEPSASRFDGLDRHVVRMSLERDFKGRTSQNPIGNAQFEAEVRKMLAALRPPGPEAEWLEFLVRRTYPDTPRILALAEKETNLDDPEHHLQVMSRASLLLRLATGTCERLLKEASLERGDLRFWWGRVGANRGLWSPGKEPVNCSDLWGDVGAAIADERAWLASNSGGPTSFSKWRSDRVAGLAVLGECERIGLWGLGF